MFFNFLYGTLYPNLKKIFFNYLNNLINSKLNFFLNLPLLKFLKNATLKIYKLEDSVV